MVEEHRAIYTRNDWNDALDQGWMTRAHFEERLWRIAVREFGEMGSASYDDEGFFESLTADGLSREGIGHFQVYTNDHDPPHVHVTPSGCDRNFDLRFSLETGELLSEKPKGINSKSIRRIKNVILEESEKFKGWWNKGPRETLM